MNRSNLSKLFKKFIIWIWFWLVRKNKFSLSSPWTVIKYGGTASTISEALDIANELNNIILKYSQYIYIDRYGIVMVFDDELSANLMVDVTFTEAIDWIPYGYCYITEEPEYADKLKQAYKSYVAYENLDMENYSIRQYKLRKYITDIFKAITSKYY